MTTWRVMYCPTFQYDWAQPSDGVHEIPCYRVVPEEDPERWVAQTNPNLVREVQEDVALRLAYALNRALG